MFRTSDFRPPAIRVPRAWLSLLSAASVGIMREMGLASGRWAGIGRVASMKVRGWLCLVGLVASVTGAAERQQDTVLADFEGGSYGDWQTTGTAFGRRPAF